MVIKVVGDIVSENATHQPDAVALRLADSSLTWTELDARAASVASSLAAAGVGSGDRVGLIDKNGFEYFELLFGCARLGAVLVAVNWRLAAPEMAYILNDAEAKVVVVHHEFGTYLADFRGDLAHANHIVVIGEPGKDQSYEAWLEATPGDVPTVRPDPDDVAFQLYTSGTTGNPKGALLSHNALIALLDVATSWGMEYDSVNLGAMPLFHIGGSGWTLFGMAMGAETVLLREADPGVLLQFINDHRITHAFLVPAVLQFLQLMPLEGIDLSSMKLIAYGASPITEEVLIGSMEMFDCDFMQVYGLTETTGAVTMLPPDDHRAEPEKRAKLLRAAGKAMPGIELRIVNTDILDGIDMSNPPALPDGEVGEIWIKSPANMVGYWKLPDPSREALPGGNWFRSGDAGYLDDGYLFLHDRVKDMIISGGENVYPAEIENALMKHECVADCAVIGVPSDRWGETPKAMVVCAPGTSPEENEIIEHCRTLLARFKCPSSVDFVDAIPRNPTGKVLKKDLRAPFWEGRDRAVN